MKLFGIRVVSTALVLVAAVASTGIDSNSAYAQGAAGASPDDAAQSAFLRGKEHGKAGRWLEAVAAFEEAYRLRPAWDIAGNLGIAELELGRFVPAARHLEEARRNFPGGGEPAKRALMDDTYKEALAKVGRLAIKASVGRASISVDDEVVGEAPLGRPIFVSPGTHRVAAVLDGVTATKSVDVAAGGEAEVLLVLEAAPSSGPVTPPPPGDEDEEGRPLWPGLVLGGIGLAGVGVGVGLLVASSGATSDASDFESQARDAGTTCRGNETSGLCGDAAASLSDSDGLATGSLIGFVIGGAAVLGAVTYLLWPESTEVTSSPGQARFVPLVGPERWGASATVPF